MNAGKVVIAAGTGFLGRVLCRHFTAGGYQVVVLTRGAHRVENGIRFVSWDARNRGDWERELEGADILVNLAGKSVDCRYTDTNKKEILSSRVDSTRALADAIRHCENPPRHWLNSSTATIYRHSEDKRMDEVTGEIGHDFSMGVAKAWEAAFFEGTLPRTRRTALRTSIVLGSGGGAFPAIRNLVRLGFGGRQGSGQQFISWIHEHDFARAIDFIIDHQMEGVVNIAAPEPIRNNMFMRLLRKMMKIPAGLPLSRKMLEFGAQFIGTETELVLKSRNVVPGRLINAGFTFKYGYLEAAFKNLLS